MKGRLRRRSSSYAIAVSWVYYYITFTGSRHCSWRARALLDLGRYAPFEEAIKVYMPLPQINVCYHASNGTETRPAACFICEVCGSPTLPLVFMDESTILKNACTCTALSLLAGHLICFRCSIVLQPCLLATPSQNSNSVYRVQRSGVAVRFSLVIREYLKWGAGAPCWHSLAGEQPCLHPRQ